MQNYSKSSDITYILWAICNGILFSKLKLPSVPSSLSLKSHSTACFRGVVHLLCCDFECFLVGVNFFIYDFCVRSYRSCSLWNWPQCMGGCVGWSTLKTCTHTHARALKKKREHTHTQKKRTSTVGFNFIWIFSFSLALCND